MNHTYRLQRSKRKRLPEGWELIEPTLNEFEERMREAVNETHEGKRKNESTWEITRIHWERNRFIYEVYYKKKAISRELYDYLVQAKVADQNLIAKWRKPGYETLCSLQAIAVRDTNYGTVGSCRVPLKHRSPQQWGPNVKTGCISCASCDKGAPIWWFHTGWREHFEGERARHVAKKSGGKASAAEQDREDALVEERIKRLKGEMASTNNDNNNNDDNNNDKGGTTEGAKGDDSGSGACV
eukprot:CAMPEP_0198236162 /NCGR_PEP_ID=MMETSP1446-20131203/2067_1 /TAXON_ID=1461542 ORGANISM="Unidentified sp, Strain CCMP2111" /NCGR_SAMPLE_ID=MMETSP1446 /ASSEMBLY_ACC=CAM_ASM_001112 /LENGTH=240 /DNA_ID=CAMNT_0043917763 /DNA_START=97 /DNA_END=819 /DNA_ORIENTATION=-